jgi:hypothetical protein
MSATAKSASGKKWKALLLDTLMALSVLAALYTEPVSTLANRTDSDEHNHSHTPSLRSDAENKQVEAFSLGKLFSGPSITLENFPLQPVEAMARQIAKDLQPAVKRPIHVVTVNRKERTPLAAVSRHATMCIVVLNSNPDGWAVWERFFDRVPDSERMNVVELSIAHEIGHCVDRENSTTQASGRQEIWEGELFADIFATLYANQYMGERGEQALSALKAIREEYASAEPTHATGESLKALEPRFNEIRLQQLSAQTLVQTASLLKAQQLQ